MDNRAELIGAVKAVREQLGDSQQAFAGRLRVAIRSVAHYEKDRPPRGRTLFQLARLAHDAGLSREEAIFRAAFRQELGGVAVSGLLLHLAPATDLERVWVGAI